MTSAGHHSMMGGKRVLPYDAEVEYIETDGNAFVNTGLFPDNGTGVKIDFMCNKLNRANHLFGSVDASGYRFEAFVRTTNAETKNMSWYWFSSSAQNINDGVAWYGRRATIEMNYMNSRKGLVDSVELVSFEDSSVTLSTPVYLIGYDSNGSATVSQDLRLYSAQFTSGTVLVRDFIPVRFTNENGVSEGALYDRANPTVGMNPDGTARTDGLYRNRGTGAFTIGPDI